MLASAGERTGYADQSPAITRIPLSQDSWALVAIVTRTEDPGELETIARSIRDHVSEYPPAPAGKDQLSLAFVRVPGDNSLIGPAFLHYSPASGSTAYCARSEIGAPAAAALQVLLASLGPQRTGALRHLSGPVVPQLSVVPVPHGRLVEQRSHPVAVSVREEPRTRRATARVCENMITVGLADLLGALWAAQARSLPDGVDGAAPPAGALHRGESGTAEPSASRTRALSSPSPRSG